jgi:hypothetical protein
MTIARHSQPDIRARAATATAAPAWHGVLPVRGCNGGETEVTDAHGSAQMNTDRRTRRDLVAQ